MKKTPRKPAVARSSPALKPAQKPTSHLTNDEKVMIRLKREGKVNTVREVTTRNGLLYYVGDSDCIPLPEADAVASKHGFNSAEAFVRALKGANV